MDRAFDKHFPALIDIYNGLTNQAIAQSSNQIAGDLCVESDVKKMFGAIIALHSKILMRSGYYGDYPRPELKELKDLFGNLQDLVALLEGNRSPKSQTGKLEGLF